MLMPNKVVLFLIILVFSLPSLGKEKHPSLLKGKLSAPLPANLFIELAKLINPAVVNISIKNKPRVRSPHNKFRRKDPFFDLFEQFLGPQNRQAPPEALGTGFVIRKDGLIITNNHVIQDADEIKVTFQTKGEKSFDAEVIGRDSTTDIALIKIISKERKKFPVTQLGESKDLQVGEWVAAFGNPLGLGHTMTKGIITAIGREISELNRFPFLQTDASINPGNSGGPLVDSKGYVIGVNSAIARGNGIGFAIPVDDVKIIIEKLEKTGRVIRGYIGVVFSPLEEKAIKYYKLKSKQGLLVNQVQKDGPADKAGIEPGDILFEFEKTALFTSQDVMNSVANSKIGSKQKITLLRDGKKKVVSVKIGIHPEDKSKEPRNATAEATRQNYEGQKAPFDLGFSIESYSPSLSNQYGLSSSLKRPIVLNVVKDSPADRSGLQAGDIILSVNQKTVRYAKDVIRKLINGPNALAVERSGSQQFIFIEP